MFRIFQILGWKLILGLCETQKAAVEGDGEKEPMQG